jgi:hypothetical protein
MPLLESGFPFRAVARDLTFGGQRIATPALTIARNEVGAIDVSAGSAVEVADANQEARYLAAKVAPMSAHEQRTEHVQAGARRVVEQEIAPTWSDRNDRIEVKTDDAASPRE